MNTKKRILDEALTLFSEKGYANVFVAEIAEAVGIKAPSLYKHYKSKQDIFNAIIEEMKAGYEKQAQALDMDGSNPASDADFFADISEDRLVETGVSLFMYFLHDEYSGKFRKMLTLEQFKNKELAELYTAQYNNNPLSYQSALFGMLSACGTLKQENPQIMALQFYSPIYMLLTMCDRCPEQEKEFLALLEQHIRQFSRIYAKSS